MQPSWTQMRRRTHGFAAAVLTLCAFAQPSPAMEAKDRAVRKTSPIARRTGLPIAHLSLVRQEPDKRPVILFTAGRHPQKEIAGRHSPQENGHGLHGLGDRDKHLAQQVMDSIVLHKARAIQVSAEIGIATHDAKTLRHVVAEVEERSQGLGCQATATVFGGRGLSSDHTEQSYAQAAEALKQAGASFVVVGYQTKNNMQVAQEAKAVVTAGLIPVVCFTEARGQRDEVFFDTNFLETIKHQVRERTKLVLEEASKSNSGEAGVTKPKMMLAYTPDWTHDGSPLTAEEVGQVHNEVRLETQAGRQGHKLLYGGKVTADIAEALMRREHGIEEVEHRVDGFLMTGSEVPSDFSAILKATLSPFGRWIDG